MTDPRLPDDAVLLDALFASSPISVSMYDAGGHVVAGNAAWERHFGVRLADVPAEWSLLTDPQLEVGGITPLIRRAYAGEEVALPALRYDAARVVAAGRAVWTRAHAYPVRDASGAVTHVVLVHVDVTELVETENALRVTNAELAERNALLQEQAMESEAQAEELQNASEEVMRRADEAARARDEVETERERLGRVIAQMPAAVAVMEGPELRFRAMSAAYRTIIGGRDVVGLPIREALPELTGGEGGADFFALMEGVYRTGEPVRGTGVPARWDDNGDGVPEDHLVDLVYAPLLGAPDPDGGRAVEGVIVLVLDVTPRARAEAALRESEARFRTMADAAPVMLWVTEPDGYCTFLNRRWYEFTGQTTEEGLGLGWLDAVHPDDRPRAERAFLDATERAREFRVEYRLRTKHGEYRRAVDSAAPRRGERGEFLGYIGTVTDVEERERLLDAERAALAKAERAAARARRLQWLTARLNEASSLAQVADAILESGMAAVAADAGSLALVHAGPDGQPARFETLRTRGYGSELAAAYREFPARPGGPLTECVRARRTVLVATPQQWRAEYPEAREDLEALGFRAFIAIPVVAGDRALAAVTFSFREPQAFDDATRTYLATLAEQCALAFERARLVEAELRHAERHAALLATIQDAFVAFDRDLRYTYVNARAMELLGRPAEALLGRALTEVFPQVEGTPLERALREVLATGSGMQIEASSAVTGSWSEARIYSGPDGVSLVFQDVTARRRAQDATALLAEASRMLAASLDYETTLRAVADAAVPRFGDWCAVDVVADPTAGAWPPRVERLAVVHRDPAMLELGAELTRRYPTDWAAESGMAPVLRSGTPFFLPQVTDEMLVAGAIDAEHLRLLRALQFSSIIVVPLVARGLTLGALTLCMTESRRRYDDADLAVALDLGQRAGVAVDNARLFREAERARAEAEAANRAKSDFLATMSHELRTPLNAIQGHVQLLDMELHGPVTDEQRRALDRVAHAQRHLLGLIDEVLGYARLESGRIEYDVRPVRAADVVADVLPMVEPQFAAKGIALEASVADVRVRADREKLAQVLINLLSNAAKFTPAGGTVRIVAEPAPAGAPAGALVRLCVADSGIGIPADKLEAIFEPFVQVRGPYSPGAGGTGLGLAISRDLARGMGGDLRATSVPGEGSTFVITLPAA